MQLDGKTEVGKISSEVKLDPAQASKNKLDLTFNSEKRLLEIEFPEKVSNPTDIKVAVNGKEVGTSTLFEVDVVAHQEIEVHAVFSVNNESYTTEKAKVTIGETPDDDEVITLKLSKDVAKRLKDAESARKAKEEEAKKAEEKKTAITSFLQDYRTEIFSPVSSRSNTYSKYYDTSSDAYKEMVEWTTGGGVKKAEIDYYTPGVFNVLSVTEENGTVIVKTHEEYTVHYVTSRKDSQSSKDKTYTLKTVGDTYVITAIAVTAGN